MDGIRKLKTCVIISVFVLTIVSIAHGRNIYVDDDAPPGGNGWTWSQAFRYLQDAIAVASSGDPINVAQGAYKPDQGAGITPGNRYATFQLKNSVTIKGGYAGLGAPNPHARDIIKYKTILSGDLNGDDGPDFTNYDENSYHVVTGSGTNATAVLDGFIVTKGNANGNNPSWNYGGGGGMYNFDGDPTVLNCIFIANSGSYTGGIFNRDGSGPTFVNCIINCNRSMGYSAGGMENYYASTNVVNCTFVNNTALWVGSAMYNYHCSTRLTNCIVWANTCVNRSITIFSQITGYTPVVSYCCVQDNNPDDGTVFEGTGNIDDDPLFLDADGADNIPGTIDDNLRLMLASPCLDSGDNSAVPSSVVTDLDSDTRIANGTVDMGVFEGPDQHILPGTESLNIPEGQTAAFTVALVNNPHATVEVAVAVESGDPDITVESGALLIFDSSNYSQPKIVTLAAAQDPDYFHGQARIVISAPGLYPAWISATELDDDAPKVLYVDSNATGASNGTSWANAFIHLQDALSAGSLVPEVEQICVAKGVYTPDKGSGFTLGDRNATFRLVSGITIKAGYAGFGQPDPNHRDPIIYETILSGDLNADDVDVNKPADLLLESTRSENCYHVVTGSGTNETTVLDGFTITGGNGSSGGGMYNNNGSPTLRLCTFRANSSHYNGGSAGGMYNNNGSHPSLTNCKFIGNAAVLGGGMSNRNSSPTLINCTFIANAADSNMYDGDAGGGAIDSRESSSPTLINCTFVGNSATEFGGAIVQEHGTLTLTNCILWNNTAPNANMVYLQQGYQVYAIVNISYSDIEGWQSGFHIEEGCTLNWGAGNIDANPHFVRSPQPPSPPPPGQSTVSSVGSDNSWINGDYHLKSQAGRWKPSIYIGLDPAYDGFIDLVDFAEFANYWQKQGQAIPADLDRSGIVDLSDLGLLLDNYLKSYTLGEWVLDSVTSPCIDAGDPISAWTAELWPHGKRINMGAYGATPEASMSLSNAGNIADFVPDDYVAYRDMMLFMDKWLCEGLFLAEDLDRNGFVNFADFAIFADNWEGKPEQASNPNPPDGTTIGNLDYDLSWTAGSYAASHNVSFGTSNPPPFIRNQTDTTFDPGTMAVGFTYYWRIDEVSLIGTSTGTTWSFTTMPPPPPPPLPGKAGNPNPANGATDVGIVADLNWMAGTFGWSHDVYFGTSSPPPFVGNQTSTIFDTGTMDYNTTYYWRIDEVNPTGMTAGSIWHFTTAPPPPPPGQASNPNPADGATGVSRSADLIWTPGTFASSHDVYFGTTNPPPFLGNQTHAVFDTGTMAYSTWYYWHIDQVNPSGTTTGSIWSFKTKQHVVPPP